MTFCQVDDPEALLRRIVEVKSQNIELIDCDGVRVNPYLDYSDSESSDLDQTSE